GGGPDDQPDNKPDGDSASGLTLDGLQSAKSCPVQLDTSSSSLPSSAGLSNDKVEVSTIPGGTDPFIKVVCRFASKPEDVQVDIVAVTQGSGGVFSTDGVTNWAYNATGVQPGDLKSKAKSLSSGEVAVLEGNGQSLAVRGTEVEGSSDALILVSGGAGSDTELSGVAKALQIG
ncbi:MAG: hypothetical protein ACRDP4_07945, partial [Nocardioidaceae bacterium]